MSIQTSMIFFVAIIATSAVSANITVAIGNARYIGHYLFANLTGATQSVQLSNPPIDNTHRWIVNWDAMYTTTGSSILAYSTRQAAAPTFFATAPTTYNATVPLMATPGNWIMQYRVLNNNYIYQLKSAVAATPGCLFDVGHSAIYVAPALCGTEELRAWWYIYSA